MRYYDLRLTDDAGHVWQQQRDGRLSLSNSTTGSTFSSLMNGVNNPAALNIEIDAPIIPYDTPQGIATITISGVGVLALGQSADLNGANVSLSAGMTRGLPLAKPQQAGTILEGRVFACYGNWEGTNQSLTLLVYPSIADNKQDICFRWPAGTQLRQALATTFAQAFPGYKQQIQIADLATNSDEMGWFPKLSVLADYVRAISTALGTWTYGELYNGVGISVAGKTIYVTDATGPRKVTQLAFEDLIGQPVWMGPLEVDFKTVLRHDLMIGSLIKFPPGIVSPYALTTRSAAIPNAPPQSKSIFQGQFLVNEVHHFGNLRQPNADSWCTAFKAFPAINSNSLTLPQLLQAAGE